MDMAKYRAMFLSETREHLKNLGRGLLELETSGGREGVDALFREAHSIKGMAASMGYPRTIELAHHLEDALDGLRRGGGIVPGALDRLLAGVDLLEKLVDDIEAGRKERDVAPFIAERHSPPAATSPAPAAPLPSSVREETSVAVRLVPGAAAPSARALLVLKELGRLGTVVSCHPSEEALLRGGPVDSVVARLRTERPAAEVKDRLSRIVDVERVVVGGGRPDAPRRPRRENASRTVRVQTEVLDRFIDLTGELITTRYMLQNATQDGDWEELGRRLDHQSRLIGDLHYQVLQVRMMPLETITGQLPRLVRDLAGKTGKDVVLRVEGEDVELDRAILERLTDPLVHLVRNAVDHGIEKRGTVLVRGWRDKDMVTLEVSDDGRGMDPEKIRRKALEKGIITLAQARSLGVSDILQLVCIPGFSTAEQITETSGRGVGMDVVKSVVEAMGGSLGIDSERGGGTRFLLQLPLSVAIIHILLLECDGHTLGIPFTRVQKALELSPGEIRSAGGKTTTTLGDEEIPLLSLRKILHLPPRRFEGAIPAVITEVRGRRIALVPDRLAGQRQAFVKGLSFPLDRLQGVTGSTVLGDGSVIFIIDPQSLLEGRSPTLPPGEQTCSSTA